MGGSMETKGGSQGRPTDRQPAPGRQRPTNHTFLRRCQSPKLLAWGNIHRGSLKLRDQDPTVPAVRRAGQQCEHKHGKRRRAGPWVPAYGSAFVCALPPGEAPLLRRPVHEAEVANRPESARRRIESYVKHLLQIELRHLGRPRRKWDAAGGAIGRQCPVA